MVLRKLGPSLVAIAMTLSIASRAPAETADDVNRARELFIEGAKLSEAGKWEAAREKFEQSLKKKRAALTLYNLGIAQQETGHLVDAIESFKGFVAMPEEPATQEFVPQVRAVIPKLEARVPRVDIDVKPAQARGLALRIDGRDAHAPPGPWLVDPGAHEIVATLPGYGEVRQKVLLGEGGRTSLSLSLGPAPAPPPGALPIGLTVGGLVLFVGGEVMFGIGTASGLGLSSSAKSGRALMVTGNVIAGAGAIAATVGFILLLQRTPRARKAALAPWANGDVGGVELRF